MGASTRCWIDWACRAGRSEPLALSGGEQQRVAVASVLVMGTRLIVLDEPAAELDPGGTGRSRSSSRAGRRRPGRPGRGTLAGMLAVAGECVVLEAGKVAATPAAGHGPRLDSPTHPRSYRLAQAAGVPADGVRRAGGGRCLAARPAEAPAHTPRLKLEAPDLPGPAPGDNRNKRASCIATRAAWIAVRGVDLTMCSGRERRDRRPERVRQDDAGQTFQRSAAARRGSVASVAKPWERRVSDLARLVGFVFQNPDDQLFQGRVDREVALRAAQPAPLAGRRRARR